MRSESIQNLERNSMAGVLEDYNKTPAELELELSKAKGRVARLEALLGKRADVADDAERAAELGASFVATLARHQAGPEEFWAEKVGTAISQPDGYSGCGVEKPESTSLRDEERLKNIQKWVVEEEEKEKWKPSWAKPELRPLSYLPERDLEAEARHQRIVGWSIKLNGSAGTMYGHAAIFSDLADRITELEVELKRIKPVKG
jgi:hypothetical protein